MAISTRMDAMEGAQRRWVAINIHDVSYDKREV
jgi:hypothetical protein